MKWDEIKAESARRKEVHRNPFVFEGEAHGEWYDGPIGAIKSEEFNPIRVADDQRIVWVEYASELAEWLSENNGKKLRITLEVIN